MLDEAGMTADADWYRLLVAVEKSGARMVPVGDHRQLSAVGGGGSFEALQGRHPDAVHVLDENVRQRDPGEREALGQLRDGDPAAVDWYQANGRITAAPTRAEVLEQAVTGWAADVARGQNAALYAWQRAHVALLNQYARQAQVDDGKIDVDRQVVDPHGRPWAEGDWLVTLAPNREGRPVTSERGRVVHVAEVDGQPP